MTRGRDLWLMLPRPIRSLPADLAAVIVLTALTILVATAPGIRETPLRIVLDLPFVLFLPLPGYASITALFPERGTTATVEAAEDGVDGIERVDLWFGLSIAIVPLLGFVLNFTP